MAAAAAVSLAGFRVAEVSTEPIPSYTWESALDAARNDLHAGIAGVRREALRQKAGYTQMWEDTQFLHESLRRGEPAH